MYIPKTKDIFICVFFIYIKEVLSVNVIVVIKNKNMKKKNRKRSRGKSV